MGHANKQLRAFEIAAGDPAVELFLRHIKVSQAPIGDAHFSLIMINQDVSGLDVAVNDTLRMRKVQADQDLQHIPSDVLQTELGPQLTEVGILNVLEHEAGCTGRRISDNVHQINDERTALQSLQHFDLSPHLHPLHRLEHLDDDV